MSQTMEQLRAKDALERTNEIERREDDFKKNYRAYVERLGPAILMNGLGQALASERAAGNEHEELFNNVARWLCREGGVYPRNNDLLSAVMTGSQRDYVRAQAEALAWIEWHKKFCAAILPRRS